jgi:hypothetical protein
MLISNVLYHGIKGFVLSENVFAQKIPGAASLLKLGQNAMSAASPTDGEEDRQPVGALYS